MGTEHSPSFHPCLIRALHVAVNLIVQAVATNRRCATTISAPLTTVAAAIFAIEPRSAPCAFVNPAFTRTTRRTSRNAKV